MRLLGNAVEVGTHRGDFAEQLLRRWRGTLWCIDPWGDIPGYESQAKTLISALGGAKDRKMDMLETQRKLRNCAPARHRLLQECSPYAASLFLDNSLSFVYLDGDHSFEAITADLAAWWPKVLPGGIFAGHDWLCPGPVDAPDNWGRNIQPAVAAFCEYQCLDLWVVVEEGGLPWSFYVIKPGEE
jgi:hypothetical protein